MEPQPDGGAPPYRRTAVPIGSADLDRSVFDDVALGTGAQELAVLAQLDAEGKLPLRV